MVLNLPLHIKMKVLLLYSFDNATGIVANDGISIFNNDGEAYGLEFSRSSQKLYLSSTSGFRSDLGAPPVTYKLFQFDLTAANIAATQTLIHQETGFRGALQLGPDGKIYATIPQAYDDANGDAQFLDAIENPNADAANVLFTQNAISLNGRRATQGLPPFISSLLLPLELTESGSTTPLNDQTLDICSGTNITFSPENVAGNPTYVWTFDNGTSIVELTNGSTPNLSLTNITNANNGLYTLTVTVIDACGNPTILIGEFTLAVFETPIAVQPANMLLCDTDNNGSAEFILTDQDATIINGATGMSVSYYLTQAEADTGDLTTALTSPYDSPNDTIYARIQNDGNTNCYDTTSFNIEVYDTPFPSTTVSTLSTCDNTSVGSDTDGFVKFNLEDRMLEILNSQAATDFTLTYFLDAPHTMQIPVADVTNFTNTIAGGQTIYVEMTNNFYATCTASTSFDIEVFELPVLLNSAITLIQCNDDLTLIEPFNLRLKENEISANFALETFTYYETPAEADTGTPGTEITNPMAYPNQIAGFDTVWVRVETNDGCHRVAQIDLDVNPSSAVMNGFTTKMFAQCDDGTDNRDEVATFDFSSVTTDIQNLFSPLTVDVLYYETEAQANQGLAVDQLNASNYDNTSQDQLIWVQIVSAFGSDCLAKGEFVQLHVEALPIANAPTTVMKECDDDQDGLFPFDTSTITSEILNGQNLTDVSITYFNQDGTPVTGVVNSQLPNPFLTASQTIDIIVTNNITNDPDGACTDATTLNFTVDILPINEVQQLFTECETDPDDGLLITTFDTSNLETSINAQVGMDITYLDATGSPLLDNSGNQITSPFPTSFISESQTITVIVTNPANTTCPQVKTVDFIVNPLPEFDLDTELQVVCENILPHDIVIENPVDNYNYEWFDPSGNSISTNQILTFTDSSLLTSEGAVFTVTATNPTTFCQRTKEITIRKSSIANITQDDITSVVFSSPNNAIEILTDNLGSGDYEFSLEHTSDDHPWQDDPIFTNLIGGVYIVLIRDKNGCGQTSLEVVLLDFPKFFTPNNDGYNDYWQLIGLENTKYIPSTIAIYDRFGKLVAQINPTGKGWNGFYNGKLLPEADYWFTVELTDIVEGTSKVYKNHFSLIRR